MVRGAATVPMDRAEAFEAALKLEPGRSALVIVDMQRAFLDPGEAMEVPAARDIVPRSARSSISSAASSFLSSSPNSRTPSRCPSSSAFFTPSTVARPQVLPEASACRPRPAS
jgi:hypothetical protein